MQIPQRMKRLIAPLLFLICGSTMGAGLSLQPLLESSAGAPAWVVGEAGLSISGSWLPAINLSVASSDVSSHDVVLDSEGRIHAVWSVGGVIEHRFLQGESWSPKTHVENGTSPDLAAGSSVSMAYVGPGASAHVVRFSTWTIAGWGQSVALSDELGQVSRPSIAQAAGGLKGVAWTERISDEPFLRYAESPDGIDWFLTFVPHAVGLFPDLAFSSLGAPMLAWQDTLLDGYPFDIFFSTRGPQGWTLPEDVSFSLDAHSVMPALVTIQGGAILAWEETDQAGSRILCATLSGTSWSEPVVCGDVGGESHFPRLVVDETGSVHLAWAAGESVLYRKLDPGTADWGEIEVVADGLEEIRGVRLAVGSGHVVVSWLSPSPRGTIDVYCSIRTTLLPRMHLPLTITSS